MEVTKEVKKIQTTGKVLRIVMAVLSALAFIGAFFLLIGSVVLAVIPDSWLSVSLSLGGEVSVSSTLPGWDKLMESIAADIPGGTVTGGGNSLTVAFGPSSPVELPVTKLLALAAFALAVQAAVYAVVFLFIGKFGKVLQKNSTPFSAPCIRYLKVTAFVLLGWSLLSLVTGGAVRLVLFGGAFFGGTPDWGLLFISLILLLMAYIFQYGAKLQRESDETL